MCVTGLAGTATHTGGGAGYFVTGCTNMNIGAFTEHAPNGNGTTFALVWFGGKTRSPAAVTCLHLGGGKLRTFTIWRVALTVCPLPPWQQAQPH